MRIKSALLAPLLVLATFVITGLSDSLVGVIGRLSDNMYLSAVIMNFLAFLLPLAFYLRVRGLKLGEATGVRRVKNRDISFIAVASVMTVVGLAILRYIAFYTSDSFSEATEALPVVSGSEEALIVLSLAVLPAFLEELLFRGVLFYEYRKYGPALTVVFTSVCFAMLHFSFASLPFYFFGGVMFGIITVVCDSTLPAIILHMLCNIVSLYFQENFLNYINQSGNNFLLLYVLIAAFLVCLWFFIGQVDSYYKRRAIEKSGYERRRELLSAGLEADASPAAKKLLRSEGLAARLSEIFFSPSFLAVAAFFVLKAAGVV
ncbi:MAG: type II CAAX endopeptidase family protein [Firmicutes bacterium]|nr:type II CAAX endopeptidase family protein [Bacillota bacterium]